MTIREIAQNKLNNLWQNLGKLGKEELSQELVELSALLGNFSENLVDLEKRYTEEKCIALELVEKVNKAEIMAQKTDAYLEYKKAKGLKDAVIEVIRAIKYRLRILSDEQRESRNL